MELNTNIPLDSWKEKHLFEWLKENWDDTIHKAEDTFSRWDCEVEGNDGHIELKCRRKHYDTMLIEKKKFDALMDTGSNPIYINSTPNGIYLWYLSDNDIEWKIETKHPATTSFSNTNRVAKEVGYLSVLNSLTLYSHNTVRV
jgi:di/tripeptidase